MAVKRDLKADLSWINDPYVCFSPRVREICDHAIQRAMEAEEKVEAYTTAARAIALWLKDYCDESLSYAEMIADAARKASKELESRQHTLDDHYANAERLWQWAREKLTGEISNQFWQIVANGHLMHENPEYHQRINGLKHRVDHLRKSLVEEHEHRLTVPEGVILP